MPVSWDRKRNTVRLERRSADAHMALLRELERVGDQIPEDKRELRIIRIEGRYIMRFIEDERHARPHYGFE